MCRGDAALKEAAARLEEAVQAAIAQAYSENSVAPLAASKRFGVRRKGSLCVLQGMC